MDRNVYISISFTSILFPKNEILPCFSSPADAHRIRISPIININFNRSFIQDNIGRDFHACHVLGRIKTHH